MFCPHFIWHTRKIFYIHGGKTSIGTFHFGYLPPRNDDEIYPEWNIPMDVLPPRSKKKVCTSSIAIYYRVSKKKKFTFHGSYSRRKNDMSDTLGENTKSESNGSENKEFYRLLPAHGNRKNHLK